MVGRFNGVVDFKALSAEYGIEITEGLEGHVGSYNLCPTETYPIVIMDSSGKKLKVAKFGLQGDNKPITSASLRQARALGVSGAKSCIIPVAGWYYWESISKRNKQPKYVTTEDPIMLGGIYIESEAAVSFAILTLQSYPIFKPHYTMPLMIGEGADQWLKSDALFDTSMITQLPEADIDLWPVGKNVNHPSNKDINCILQI